MGKGWGIVDEAFNAAGTALCCAAAIRLGGAVQVLTTRSALLDHYNPIMAGLENITAFLDGRGLDDNLLGSAFAESWSLDARYPADLAGHAYVKGWSSLVFGTVVLTRPKQQNITSAKTLEFTSKAAASWPTAVRIGSFDSLLRFEAACQQEAEARMREGGLPALWKLTEDRTKQYRQTTEQFIG
ncbi:hypothetical protein SAM23877_0582 [Streptomyces ambofaciens ATCC 23877]|uniref:Uncharacterized protein n=1 Tax=Streptomyces ambofaciens (strain ATCC 23877 / 3486 / DSM 40053 / JCM 4204 / NBRC 12836 / NRRL B-2516) TaxID=278992 RepID=A0A0K2AL45_STRA7|nr:hypothetical protein SAM23877_0582 [Streptomyces ambofaciens ATCC 23877]